MMVAPAIAAAGIGAVTDLAGGLVNQYFADEAGDKAWKRQKKVLQNQVQWRVADAVAAGLHPLAALGMSPASGPSAVVDGSLGSAISSMGQNIGRAAEAYLTPEDKSAARIALLAEERAGLENQLLRAQIAGAQKALLTQGATAGVASALPTPITQDRWSVLNPGAGQKAEDNYGDFGGSAFGVGYLLQDLMRNMGGQKVLETTAKEWAAVQALDRAVREMGGNHRDYTRVFENEPWY